MSDPVWPVEQEIRAIQIDTIGGQETEYSVGRKYADCVITEIRKVVKPGQYASLPYVQVWVTNQEGDSKCIAEFCQHNIVGVYYS